ncbi:MAG: TatD family hydrolase [Minisyncoccia bacterium]
MKYIDAHTHLNLPEFENDRELLAQKTLDDDVMVVNVGTGEQTSIVAVDLATQHDHMRAIVGLHPIYTIPSYASDVGEKFDPEFYRILIKNDTQKNILAIGECGLDYFHGNDTEKDLQKQVFRAQVELAIETELPLMLHIRPSENTYDAYHDVLNILREYKVAAPNLIGDVHFFAGTTEIAQEFLDLGFYISFTGVITFAKMYQELVRFVPMNRILSETDAPYVSPVPFRGQRNEPSHVREVVKKIAEIKNIPESDVATQIMENARTLFKL